MSRELKVLFVLGNVIVWLIAYIGGLDMSYRHDSLGITLAFGLVSGGILVILSKILKGEI